MEKNRTSTDGAEMRIPLLCLTAEPSSCTISGTVVRLAITSVSLVVEAEEEETVEDSLRLLDTWGKKQHYKLQCGKHANRSFQVTCIILPTLQPIHLGRTTCTKLLLTQRHVGRVRCRMTKALQMATALSQLAKRVTSPSTGCCRPRNTLAIRKSVYSCQT